MAPAPQSGSDVPRVAVTLTQCWHRVPGGTATSVLEMIRALRSEGLAEVVGVAPAGRGLPDQPFRPDVPLHRLALPLRALYDSWVLTGRPRVHPDGVDLVHMTVPVAPSRGSLPMVATVHDVLPLDRPEDFTGRGARLMRAGLARIRDEADRVVVPSRVVADACESHGFDRSRVTVVPWGAPRVDPSEVDDEAVARVRSSQGIVGDFVLFVGTAEPRKGLATLARALVQLGRADLTLAVAGPSGWGDSGEDELAAVPGPVARLGFVDPSDLPALRRAAAACCVPSLAEGFGLPVLEAFAAGGAVVTSSGTATEEVAGDAALLVPPGDAGALAEALGRVLDDAALAALLRSRGLQRASELSWRNTVRAVADVYAEVLR